MSCISKEDLFNWEFEKEMEFPQISPLFTSRDYQNPCERKQDHQDTVSPAERITCEEYFLNHSLQEKENEYPRKEDDFLNERKKLTMKEKISRAKLLLAKKRREDKTPELLDKREKNTLEIWRKKKEILLRKNREAAQKSRMNRKLEMENLKKQNQLLHNELNKYKDKIEKVCLNCKCIFEDTSQDEKGTSNLKKKKIFTVNSTSSSQESNRGRYALITGLVVCVCLFGNILWKVPTEGSPLKERVLEEVRIPNDVYNNEVINPGKKIKIKTNSGLSSFIPTESNSGMLPSLKFEDCINIKTTKNNESTYDVHSNKDSSFLASDGGTGSRIHDANKCYRSISFQLSDMTEIPCYEEDRLNVTDRLHKEDQKGNTTTNLNDSDSQLDSQIIEQNSKKFYYEIECKILNIEKHNK